MTDEARETERGGLKLHAERGAVGWLIVDQDGYVRANVPGFEGSDELAGRIVRAFNAHDALTKLARELIGADQDDTWDTDRQWLRDAALAALSKAKDPHP